MNAIVNTQGLVRKALLAALLGWAGFAVGCASTEGDEVPSEEAGKEAGEEATGEQAQALCCISYTCPSNGFETMGCTGGSSGPGAALARCNNACPVNCQAGVLECF